MSEALQEFLQANLPLEGLAAWGARLPDGTWLTRCYNDGFTAAQVEQLATSLVVAARGLDPYGLQPVRLCWVFEHARLHLALRREGDCLALLMENRPELANAEVDRVLDAFEELPRSW